MKIKDFNPENSKPKKREGGGRKKRRRSKGGKEEEERGWRERLLQREYVNILVIFRSSIINKTSGNDLDSILQGRK